MAATVLYPFSVSLEESGERHLYASTSGRFPPKDGNVEVPATQKEGGPMKGSDGTIGSGAYLVGKHGEFKANEGVLKEFRDSSVRGVSDPLIPFFCSWTGRMQRHESRHQHWVNLFSTSDMIMMNLG